SMRAALTLAAFLLATTAFGAFADLSVTLSAPKTEDAAYSVIFRADVTNNGPDTAVHVRIAVAGAFTGPIICFDDRDITLQAGETTSRTCAATTLQRTGIATVGVSVTSDATDPDPSNNA